MFDFAELLNWNEYVKVFLGLFALVSPPIILPLFLGVVGQRTAREKRQTAVVGALSFAVIMLIFTFLGTAVLDLFGITISAFRVAGGLLLLLIALDMMRSDVSTSDTTEADSRSSAISLGIVPIAVPILAGPGAISTLIIFATDHPTVSHQFLVAIVVVVISIYVFLAFQFSIRTEHLFSPTMMIVFYRVMGLIVAAIAIEFILDGIAAHFPMLEISHE